MNYNYDKFGRNFVLQISGPAFPTPLEITLPFTIEFEINRKNYGDTNSASIRIYNLSKQHRDQIIHDQMDTASIEHTLFITLQAGYGVGPNYPLIFKGNATRAYSTRQGTDFLTTIEAQDGGVAYTNAVSSHSFGAGTPITQVYETLIADLLPYGVSKGAVSEFTGTLGKGGGFCGNTVELLTELTNGNFFVDNLKANILTAFDAIGGNDVVINSSSGLLGTPLKEQQILLVDMLFEPRLVVGSTVTLDSTTVFGTYNGKHKVISVEHRATISAAVCGDAVTRVGLQAGVFGEVLSATGL